MFICMNVESINVCASMHKCVYMVCAGKVIELKVRKYFCLKCYGVVLWKCDVKMYMYLYVWSAYMFTCGVYSMCLVEIECG